MKNRPALSIPVLAIASILMLSGCHMLKGGKPLTTVMEGFSSPESVIKDPASGRFFVSNVGERLEPSVKDGDGFISEVAPDGKILNKKFLPKEGVLDAPKGMAIVGGTLYVTDIDRVVGFDMGTSEKTVEVDFSTEKTVFLNDLAVIDDTTLAVSATDIGEVYKVALGATPSYSVIAENIPGANGLSYDRDGKRLFVVSFGDGTSFNGALGVITLKDGTAEYRALTDKMGALDGLALIKGERLIFSDWVAMDKPGKVMEYDLKTGALSEFKLSGEVRGPADFYYDEKEGKLWLPRMLEGKVNIECVR